MHPREPGGILLAPPGTMSGKDEEMAHEWIRAQGTRVVQVAEEVLRRDAEGQVRIGVWQDGSPFDRRAPMMSDDYTIAFGCGRSAGSRRAAGPTE
jgi:hypothetical protein